jgi:hypothetical protein
MVRPANFAFNEETAANNAFQSNDTAITPEMVKEKAIREFDGFVERLKKTGVNVIVAPDTAKPVKPDAVFPNNWVSFHQEGFVITYPMFALTRRHERRRKILEIVTDAGFYYDKPVRLEREENRDIFLEGTGSIVFDHRHRIAYACLSPRTDANLLKQLCTRLDYRPVIFRAADEKGRDIYHTNVMMAVGESFVVVCLESVPDEKERATLEQVFKDTKKVVVPISHEQMNAFAGNMLQVRARDNQTYLVMSEQAWKSLHSEQIKLLERHTKLLPIPLYTIEKYGGGSVRCMMAEVFEPIKNKHFSS